MAGSKRSTSQIAEALVRGGVESKSKNFAGMLQVMLRREHKVGGEIVKVRGGWGLADWYGPHIRRQANGKENRPTKRAEVLAIVVDRASRGALGALPEMPLAGSARRAAR